MRDADGQRRRVDLPNTEGSGLCCPGCGGKHLPAVYTRQSGKNRVRVRQCRNCGRRIRTTEKIVANDA
jgi:transcriptional regulator NrdR family protein